MEPENEPEGNSDGMTAEMPGEVSKLTGKPKIGRLEKSVLVKMVRKGAFRPQDNESVAVCKLLVAYGFAEESIENDDTRGIASVRSSKFKYVPTKNGVDAAKMVKYSLKFGKRC